MNLPHIQSTTSSVLMALGFNPLNIAMFINYCITGLNIHEKEDWYLIRLSTSVVNFWITASMRLLPPHPGSLPSDHSEMPQPSLRLPAHQWLLEYRTGSDLTAVPSPPSFNTRFSAVLLWRVGDKNKKSMTLLHTPHPMTTLHSKPWRLIVLLKHISTKQKMLHEMVPFHRGTI